MYTTEKLIVKAWYWILKVNKFKFFRKIRVLRSSRYLFLANFSGTLKTVPAYMLKLLPVCGLKN